MFNLKMPVDFLPGSISGGLGARELFTFGTKKEDNAYQLTAKTVANFVIRSTSIAFSPYNIFSLPYLTAVTNPIMAINKGCEAVNLLVQGEKKEAGKKALEATAHVALSVFDYWTLGLSSKYFDTLSVAFVTAGILVDISKSSEKIHDKIFPQEVLDRRRLNAERFPYDYDEPEAAESEESSSESEFSLCSDSEDDSLESDDDVGKRLSLRSNLEELSSFYDETSSDLEDRSLPPLEFDGNGSFVEESFNVSPSDNERDSISSNRRGSGNLSNPSSGRLSSLLFSPPRSGSGRRRSEAESLCDYAAKLLGVPDGLRPKQTQRGYYRGIQDGKLKE